MDIIAETVSDNAEIRKRIRNLANVNGVISSVAVDAEKDSVYRQYYDYKEPVKKIADHRLLAVNRGEKEGFLKVSVEMDTERPLNSIAKVMITNPACACADIVKPLARMHTQDLFFRLLSEKSEMI